MGVGSSKRTLLAEGLWGAVFLNSDGTVTKIGKVKSLTPDYTTEFWREMRAFDWIEQNKNNPIVHRHLVKRIKISIIESAKYKHIPAFFTERYNKWKTNPESVSAEDVNWLTETKSKMDAVNAYGYVYRLTMQNKGERIDLNMMPTRQIRKVAAQLFSIIDYMTGYDIIHCDIHTGNILINNSTGDITLIDYGEVYMKGDDSYATLKAEYTMICQAVGVLININNNFELEKQQTDASKITTMERRISYALAIPDMSRALIDICRNVNYTEPIQKARRDPRKHDLVVSILFDGMKTKHADLFPSMMGYKADARVESFIDWKDLETIYLNMNNIPNIINHFI